jgi:hypothetical protein
VYKATAGLPYFIKGHLDRILSEDSSLQLNTAFRRIQEKFIGHSLFQTISVIGILKWQILNYVQQWRKKHCKGPRKITTVFDSKAWRDTYRLEHENLTKCHSKFTPRLVMGEENVQAFCKQLTSHKVLHGRQHSKFHHVPHKDMVFSDDATVEHDPRYLTIKHSPSHVTGPDPRGTTLVFTSVALHSNLCWCAKLDWKIAGAAHNICSNPLYKLLTMGVVHIDSKGKRQFYPVAYAVADGEREICALLLFLNIKIAAKNLFGLDVSHFKGGLVSDRTPVFVNSFFPETTLLQCFVHIIRKFRFGERRKMTGNTAEYKCHLRCQDIKWLTTVAEMDARNLHRCSTQPMFDKYKHYVEEAWAAAGEQHLYNVFAQCYLNDPKYSNWRFSASGVEQCKPINNPCEGHQLNTKGQLKYAGVMNTEGSYEAMLCVEFPKMIFHYSNERVEPKRHYPIMDPAIAHREKEFVGQSNTYYHLFKIGRDCVECCHKKSPTGGKMYYANDLSDLCKPIPTERIHQYEETLQGTSELDFTQRNEFAKRGSALHLLHWVQHPQSGVDMVVCNCYWYFEYGWCYPSMVMQHKESLSVDGQRVDANPKSRHTERRIHRKFRMGQLLNEAFARDMQEKSQNRQSHGTNTQPISGERSDANVIPLSQPQD